MFLGHFALGLAAKKLDPKPSLGTYFLAAQFVDLLWPFLLLAHIETVAIDPGNTAFTPLDFRSYPWSHSLVAAACWAVLLGLLYFLFRKNRMGALLIGLLVASHWLLDFITHRPDLPISFNEATKVGLGLWNNKTFTIIIELLLFCSGTYLYVTATDAKNKKGTYAFWSLILFLLVIYFMNAAGDPPPSAEMIGYAGLAQWIFIAWAYWADRNRAHRYPAALAAPAI